MKNRVFLTVVALISTLYIQAQDFTFKVLANKGSNEVKSGDAWQAIKAFSTLNLNDEIKVSPNGYLGLMHKSGKSLEIKDSGPYKVADLADRIGKGGNSSVIGKYTDFILSSNSAEAKKNRLSATGAVTRGVGINILLPANQFGDIFESTAFVSWEATKTGGPYTVVVKDMFDVELMKISTPETSVLLDRNNPKLLNQEALLIDVMTKTEKSNEPKLIKKISTVRQNEIKKLVDEMGEDIKQETALNKFIMAGFYEENKLFIDAIGAYEQAMKLAPDVPTYKEAYEEFLFRNKLKRPGIPSSN